MRGIICVSCGKKINEKEAKGSLKEPYCKECWNKEKR